MLARIFCKGLVGDAELPADGTLRGPVDEHPEPDLGPLLHVGVHPLPEHPENGTGRYRRAYHLVVVSSGHREESTMTGPVVHKLHPPRQHHPHLHAHPPEGGLSAPGAKTGLALGLGVISGPVLGPIIIGGVVVVALAGPVARLIRRARSS